MDPDKPDLVFEDRLNIRYTGSSGWSMGLENDFLRRDYKQRDLYLKRYNSLNAYAIYRQQNTYLKALLRNTLFGNATDMALYPVVQSLKTYDKQMQNIAYITVEQEFAPLSLRFESMIKALDLRPWEYVMDVDTFEFVKVQKPDDRLWDINANLSLSVQINDKFRLNTAYFHQESDVDIEDRLLQGTSSLGLSYDGKILDTADLAASFTWANNQGDIPHLERRNLYKSSLRARMSISPDLNLSLGYTNHLCSDDRLSKLLLISNYLRGSFKYSLPYDDSGSSYAVVTYKFSPENRASALLADADLKVLNSLFLGAEILYSPDSFTDYKAKSSYRLGVYNSISLIYNYTDYKANTRLHQLGIGFDYFY